ncbi:hypothetical protein WKI40_20555 [Kosakonia sacchari]|uniref:hypothetical protein n=1 Tax=Kosakonia sacchari TaxID=1158459 RepID=UPI0030BE7C94
MKKSLLLLVCFLPSLSFAKFIHPMDFDGSEAQKADVIKYIKDRVQKDYCNSKLNMCQETTLRMMEQENLRAFKEASQANDRKIMDNVIKTYCHSALDMCNYTTIEMMYKENQKASKQDLKW